MPTSWKQRALAAEAEVRRLRAIYGEEGLRDASLDTVAGRPLSFLRAATAGPRKFVPPDQ